MSLDLGGCSFPELDLASRVEVIAALLLALETVDAALHLLGWLTCEMLLNGTPVDGIHCIVGKIPPSTHASASVRTEPEQTTPLQTPPEFSFSSS